jgi:hypothetical protein
MLADGDLVFHVDGARGHVRYALERGTYLHNPVIPLILCPPAIHPHSHDKGDTLSWEFSPRTSWCATSSLGASCFLGLGAAKLSMY